MSNPENDKLTIIVVDDEDIYLSLVSDALEDEGYAVVTASTGHEAATKISQQNIDLIITDIRMPNMTGIELLQQAREIKPNIGAIFMTGYANLNSAKDAIKQGAYDYISKPFELSEIRAAVRKAADKIREEAASSQSDKQLDYLSHLSQVLIEVGDKQALATSSMKFLMMHYKIDCGAVILWNSDQTESRIVMFNGTEINEIALSDDRLTEMIKTFQSKPDDKPIIESGESFGSMLKHLSTDKTCTGAYMACLKSQSQIIRVHVRRRDTLLAILIMGPFPDDQTVEALDLKFLAITSSQLAVSLENLSLLEETQKAYDSLKKLQDETIQLEKMATRGEMSAEIGHELNNFLGVVAGNLSLLEFQINNNHADKAGKYVHAINENIDKIKKFTSNLMDLTPISTAKETVDFDKLLTEVIDYLKPQKRFSGVTINVVPTDGPVPFEADMVHLQQVLYNLFNNAADATSGRERREISVKIDTYSERSRFAVTLKDTGVGFDPETLKKAFSEKFTTKKDGHGFGLLVCKRIIDNHDGLLSIESTQGEGSTIRIEFPMTTTPARASVTV